MKASSSKRKSLSPTPAFIEKLVKILETPEYQNIISWTREGDAFVVKSVTQFTDIVLPQHFKHRNYSSFIRQLNMYNFNKVRSDEGEQVYMNEFFRKDSPAEYKNIRRRNMPGGDQDQEDTPRYYNNQQVATFNPNNPQPERNYAKQLAELTRKHKELEGICKKLFDDNQAMIAENAKLWKKMARKMEKKDKRLQKLLVFLILGNQNQKQILDDGRSGNVNSRFVLGDKKEDSADHALSQSDSSQSDSQAASTNGNRRSTKQNKSINLLQNILPLLQRKNGLNGLFKLVKGNNAGTNFKKKSKNNYTIVGNQPMDPQTSNPQNPSNMASSVHQNGYSVVSSQYPMLKGVEPNLCIKENGQSQEESIGLPSHADIPPSENSFMSDIMGNQAENADCMEESPWLTEI